MSERALKRCPFCGWRRKESYADAPRGERRYWALVCESCGAHGPSFSEYTEAEAIAAWNTRAEASSAEPVADLAGYERGQRETVARIVAWLRRQATAIERLHDEATMDEQRKPLKIMAKARVECATAIETGEWK